MKTKKCPVCDWEITDGGIKVKVGGKEITVCCDDCARRRWRVIVGRESGPSQSRREVEQRVGPDIRVLEKMTIMGFSREGVVTRKLRSFRPISRSSHGGEQPGNDDRVDRRLRWILVRVFRMTAGDRGGDHLCSRLQLVLGGLFHFLVALFGVVRVARLHLDQQVIRDAVGRGDVDVEEGSAVLRSAWDRRPWES